VKWSEGLRNRVSIIIRTYKTIWTFIASFILFFSIVYHCIYGGMFCMFCVILYIMYFYCYVCVFLLLCMFRSRYCVSLCCSLYCLSVNVYCTAATGCHSNCS
jgi:hypothetical protein